MVSTHGQVKSNAVSCPAAAIESKKGAETLRLMTLDYDESSSSENLA